MLDFVVIVLIKRQRKAGRAYSGLQFKGIYSMIVTKALWQKQKASWSHYTGQQEAGLEYAAQGPPLEPPTPAKGYLPKQWFSTYRLQPLVGGHLRHKKAYIFTL